ncbi:MAG TPA: hypothetical protein P5323_01025 [Candidatus Moranbacteria bacterium]|nr:hypothetical protein [Candidatus Moranbacteria bacterium]HRY27696.1 hypothetical protein [Candidatus Moranbacteria bacterium]HSA07981.1 hypothetical protein [Candidatus Moranbacteria bacterium]
MPKPPMTDEQKRALKILEKGLKNLDMKAFTFRWMKEYLPEAEAYRIARAKSLAAAHRTVFI